MSSSGLSDKMCSFEVRVLKPSQELHQNCFVGSLEARAASFYFLFQNDSECQSARESFCGVLGGGA